MASYVQCPACQTSSPEDAAYCFKCGASLAGAPPGAPPSTPTSQEPTPAPERYEPRYGFPVSPVSYEFWKDIDRTKTGLILLALGALLAWIPVIGFVGSLLALIGAILVILGRSAFGPKHARNVGLAIVLYIIGFIGSLALAGSLLGSADTFSTLPVAQAEASFENAFNTLLIGAIVLVIIAGPATVLFIWELLNVQGRVLILLSYAAAIGIAVLVYATIIPHLAAALSSAYSVSPPDPGPILALDAEVNALHVLQVLPALLEAGAAYIAWSRIDAGEIPKAAS